MRANIVKKKRHPPNPNGPLHASNVNWVKQQRLKGQLTVMLAMLEHLAKPKVFVQLARRVFIKTAKVKKHASNATVVNRTSIPKAPALGATLVHLAAAKAFARNAQLDSIKIPKAKQSAAKPATRQKKYPTKTVPGVNCPRGVLAKWGNI